MILKFLFWNFESIMADGVVVAASYRKNCLRTWTVGIDKLMKRMGHSQIHLLEKEWSDPEQVSSLLKLLLAISTSKREGRDKLRRCGKMSINWPNAQVFWRCGQLMQNRKSTLHGLTPGNNPQYLQARWWPVNNTSCKLNIQHVGDWYQSLVQSTCYHRSCFFR